MRRSSSLLLTSLDIFAQGGGCVDRANVGTFEPAAPDGGEHTPPEDEGTEGDGGETKSTIDLDLTPATTQIVASGTSTCAIDDGGGVKCWGDNLHGQLGAGSMTPTKSATPLRVKGLAKGVRSVGGGSVSHCAILESGRVVCWGYSHFGQVAGTGAAMDWVQYPYPHDHTGLSNDIAEVGFGYRHACALTRAGRVKCWGFGGTGQLGSGSTGDSPVAGDIAMGDDRFVHVSSAQNGFFSCAVRADGEVLCWGQNSVRQLGTKTPTDRPSPTKVEGLDARAVRVGAGGGHACAILVDGGVSCWGDDELGQLGSGSAGPPSGPRRVEGVSGVKELSVGQNHGCALLATGSVVCWGRVAFGKAGASPEVTTKPIEIVDPSFGAIGVAAGSDHTCVMNGERRVRCIGFDSESQLGGGEFTL